MFKSWGIISFFNDPGEWQSFTRHLLLWVERRMTIYKKRLCVNEFCLPPFFLHWNTVICKMRYFGKKTSICYYLIYAVLYENMIIIDKSITILYTILSITQISRNKCYEKFVSFLFLFQFLLIRYQIFNPSPFPDINIPILWTKITTFNFKL